MKLTMPWTATNGHLNGATDKLEDVRNALGREVDHLAQVAGQVGREATTQVESVAHDTGKQTGAVVNRLVETAAALGPTIAVLGRQKVRGLGKQAQTLTHDLGQQAQTLTHDLGQQAQTLGHDLRQVRLTTQPQRSGRSGIALLGGLGIGVGTGIALMYLMDPERGKDRRRMLLDRLAKWTRAGRDAAAEKASAFADRTVGVMSDLRQSVTTGIGVEPETPVVDADAPVIAETTDVEVWPEGTRVPIS
jgi:ABC-type transporter Mla subunit MlaD